MSVDIAELVLWTLAPVSDNLLLLREDSSRARSTVAQADHRHDRRWAVSRHSPAPNYNTQSRIHKRARSVWLVEDHTLGEQPAWPAIQTQWRRWIDEDELECAGCRGRHRWMRELGCPVCEERCCVDRMRWSRARRWWSAAYRRMWWNSKWEDECMRERKRSSHFIRRKRVMFQRVIVCQKGHATQTLSGWIKWKIPCLGKIADHIPSEGEATKTFFLFSEGANVNLVVEWWRQ